MLLDSDIMIDIFRGYPPAVAWLNSLGSIPVGLPGLVAMELIQGCRNLAEQNKVQADLKRFAWHRPTSADCLRAVDDFTAFRLSNGLDLLDSLIAETAVGCGLPLATFNVKHYGVISALKTIQPY